MITNDELDGMIGDEPANNWKELTFTPEPDYPLSTQLSLGVELEVELDEDCYDSEDFDAPILAIAHNTLGESCMDSTEDGSLECGAEFRSAPLTVLDTVKLFRAVLGHPWVQARHTRGDLCERRSMGLHVHVGIDIFDREGNAGRKLTHVDYMRLIMFLNDDDVHAAFQPIYNRNSSDYAYKRNMARLRESLQQYLTSAKASPDSKGQPYYEVLAKACYRALVNSGEVEKYRLLNVGTGRPTIEFRMFRGGYDPELTQTRIELCNALVRWVRSMNIGFTLEPKLSDFKTWVLRDSTQQNYGVEMPQLTQFIRSI